MSRARKGEKPAAQLALGVRERPASPPPQAPTIAALTEQIAATLAALPDDERIDALNEVRAALHEISPLKHHPVDFVRWVKTDAVGAQPLNPNTVAPPEMRLLITSVEDSGYTMPIVAALDDPPEGVTGDYYETVDGFHRGRVGKEVESIRQSTRGRLPLVQIRAERGDRIARISATVQHNRARGEHRVEAMSELVREMYQAGERDEAIMRELGMDADEVRRLKQITGLAELFRDREFSKAWEPIG